MYVRYLRSPNHSWIASFLDEHYTTSKISSPRGSIVLSDNCYVHMYVYCHRQLYNLNIITLKSLKTFANFATSSSRKCVSVRWLAVAYIKTIDGLPHIWQQLLLWLSTRLNFDPDFTHTQVSGRLIRNGGKGKHHFCPDQWPMDNIRQQRQPTKNYWTTTFIIFVAVTLAFAFYRGSGSKRVKTLFSFFRSPPWNISC